MNDAGTKQLLLSLRAWPEPDPEATALSAVIPQIQKQRGSFRDVNEAALEEEMATAAADKSAEANDTSPAKEDEVTTIAAVDQQPQPNPREALAAKRQKLIAKVEQAQQECMYAIDFVSLLLSAARPAAAQVSMSQHVKDLVPMGSLGAERLRITPTLIDAEVKMVTRGWKSEALGTASTSLLEASTRLAGVTESEGRYWDEILKIKDAGWPLCRLSREPQSLGVRYGFAEAGADYKYAGLGAIRKGVDGETVMDDLNAGLPRDKIVRVQVIRNGRITGITTATSYEDTASTISGMIERARDAVYENELFLEILREARTLANLGIRTSEDCVTIDFAKDSRAVIEMVSIGDDLVTNNTSSQDYGLAQSILTSLHLLLSHAHRRTLKKRRQPPPPIAQRPPPNPPLVLLRPVATHLTHAEHLTSFKSSLIRLISLPNSASLPCSFRISHCQNCLSRPITSVESVIDAFLGMIETSYTLTLPGSWKLTILMQTLLGPPIFGTRFLVTTSHDGSCAVLMGNNNFTSEKEVERYVQWCLERSIVNEVQERRKTGDDSWKQVGLGNEMAKSGEGGVYKRLRIEIEDAMAVRWTSEGGRDEVYEWDGKTGTKTMDEVLEGI